MMKTLQAISKLSFAILACLSTVSWAEAAETTGTFNDAPLRVDERGNVFIRQQDTCLPPLKNINPLLKDCQGIFVPETSGQGGYSIENAIGDGITVQGTCNAFQILGASGNEYVVKGNKTCNMFGVVRGAKGAAIVINGNDNTVSDIVIADDCGKPFVVNGSRNLINYAIAPIKSARPVTDIGSHMRVKQVAPNN